jgi:hypothetical protein
MSLMLRVVSTSFVLLTLGLGGCSQSIVPSNPNAKAAGLTQPEVEIDPEITALQYVQGLRRAKGLILNRPFLNAQESSISTRDEYRAWVTTYLDDPEAPLAVQKMYRQILQLEGTEVILDRDDVADILVDNDEPSSLAAYLFAEDRDFREILTADYCVSSFESGLQVKGPCTNAGRIQLNTSTDPNNWFVMSLPAELHAGAISTQAFLRKYDGALDFRRASKTREFFLCSNYPDPEERLGWTQQNAELHPFYWTTSASDQDCQSCHTALNKARTFFTGFGPLGQVMMGQQVIRYGNQTTVAARARTINDVEAATIALPSYETLYNRPRNQDFEGLPTTYHQETVERVQPAAREYSSLSHYGRILSQSDRFSECSVQRFYNYALGINQSFLNRVPPRSLEPLKSAFEGSSYNTKALLLEIFSSVDFLNR